MDPGFYRSGNVADDMSWAMNTNLSYFFSANPHMSIGGWTPLLAAAQKEHERIENTRRFRGDIVTRIKELEEEKVEEKEEKKKEEEEKLKEEEMEEDTQESDSDGDESCPGLESASEDDANIFMVPRMESTPHPTSDDSSPVASKRTTSLSSSSSIEVIANWDSAQFDHVNMVPIDPEACPKPIPEATQSPTSSFEIMDEDEHPSSAWSEQSQYCWGGEPEPRFKKSRNIDHWHDPNSPLARPIDLKFLAMQQEYARAKAAGELPTPPASEYAWGDEEEIEEEQEVEVSTKDNEVDDVIAERLASPSVKSEYAWGNEDELNVSVRGDDVINERAYSLATPEPPLWGPLGELPPVYEQPAPTFTAYHGSGSIFVDMKDWDPEQEMRLFDKIERLVQNELELMKQAGRSLPYDKHDGDFKMKEEEKKEAEKDEKTEETEKDSFDGWDEDESDEFESACEDEDEQKEEEEQKAQYDAKLFFSHMSIDELTRRLIIEQTAKARSSLLEAPPVDRSKKPVNKLSKVPEPEKLEVKDEVQILKTENKNEFDASLHFILACKEVEEKMKSALDAEKEENEKKLKQLIQMQEEINTTECYNKKIELLDQVLLMMAQDWFQNL